MSGVKTLSTNDLMTSAESGRDDERHREIDDIAAEQEIPELLEHRCLQHPFGFWRPRVCRALCGTKSGRYQPLLHRRRWINASCARRCAPMRPSHPASIGTPRVSMIDEQRRVIRRDRHALARLAIDLRPDQPVGDGRRQQQVVDAHAQVLVEVACAVVPPCEALRLRSVRSVAVDEAPGQQRGECLALRPRTRGCRRGRPSASHTSMSVGAMFMSPPTTSASDCGVLSPQPLEKAARTTRACRCRRQSRRRGRWARRATRSGCRRSRR